jgi:hypothetical protein
MAADGNFLTANRFSTDPHLQVPDNILFLLIVAV